MSLGISAATWVSLGTAGLGAYSASKGGSSQSGTQTVTNKSEMDPRMAGLLFGNGTRTMKPGVTPTYKSNTDDGMGGMLSYSNPDSDYTTDPGLLGRYTGMFDTPQSPGMNAYGRSADQYMGFDATSDRNTMRDAAYQQLGGANTAAPQMTAASMTPSGMQAAQTTAVDAQAPWAMQAARATGAPNMAGARVNQPGAMQAAQQASTPAMQAGLLSAPNAMQASTMQAAQTRAPSQNGMDLSGSYNGFVNGDAGNNPYLTGGIQKGINQSTNAFHQMQDDATDNLMKTVLPSIRSGAIVNGAMGSSRQGIAEGNAIGDYAKAAQRAASQFGQNNTDAAVAAQAGAYDTDRNRALSATQGLGAQQYGVASQDAGMDQQGRLSNQSANNTAGQTNYQGQMTGALANQAAGNTAAQTNFAGQQATNAANAGYQNQANSTNFGGLLSGALANQSSENQAAQTNYGGQQATSLANAGFGQQANATNYGGGLTLAQGNQAAQNSAANTNAGFMQGANQQNGAWQNAAAAQNAGFQQDANGTNLGAQLKNRTLNSADQMAGMGALGGLLGTSQAAAQNQDGYGLSRTSQINGLLSPYLGMNGSQSTTQPLYQNTAGNMLGGGMAGLALGKQIGGLLGSYGTGGGRAGDYSENMQLYGI